MLRTSILLYFLFALGNSWAFDYSEKVKYKVPVREYSIIVTQEGYYPKQISLFEGEKLKIFLTSTLNSPSCFMLPQKKLFMAARKGEVTEGEAYFNEPGIYWYYCPTGKIKGKITVLEKLESKKIVERKIASESRMGQWRPRDE
jgi:hypothetical protein